MVYYIISLESLLKQPVYWKVKRFFFMAQMGFPSFGGENAKNIFEVSLPRNIVLEGQEGQCGKILVTFLGEGWWFFLRWQKTINH